MPLPVRAGAARGCNNGDDDCAGAGAGAGVATTGAGDSAGAAARAGIWSAAAGFAGRAASADFFLPSATAGAASLSADSGLASTAAGSTVLTSARERSSGLAGSADFCGAGAFFSTGGNPSRTGSTRSGVMACAVFLAGNNTEKAAAGDQRQRSVARAGHRVEWAFCRPPASGRQSPGVKIALF